jgi:hypothetical protein
MSVEFRPVHTLPTDELEAASLLETKLRVWAEVGRARMPASSVVGMAEGVILDLDCESDEPADLYINGRHFGTGRLILVDGEWALRVETLDDGGKDPDDEEDAEDAEDGAPALEHSSTPVQNHPDPTD